MIHTENPTNGQVDEVYVEACRGLGESLVSTKPGQAMSFIYNKQNGSANIVAFPNKPIGLFADGFIFRSDSNSEDLAGFAGAGLFDSYPMLEEKEFRVEYSKERLCENRDFQREFMRKCGEIGTSIEKLYKGEAQDVEGAFY